MKFPKLLLLSTAIAGLAGLGLQADARAAQAADRTIVSVAYGETYVFDTEDLTKKWWHGIKSQFESAHPDVIVQLVPIGGGYDDIINKLSLLYRSPRTTPDVAQIATPVIGEFASSGYLAPLDSYLSSTSWWAQFPKVIQGEGVYQGKVYAVNTGENDSQLYYNMDMFKKAGLPVPWVPHNWNDILVAARVIKAKVPGVVPVWLSAGTSTGDNAILQGAGNLLAGSDMPTIYDDKTSKWVVDSPGLRETLDFFHSIYSEHMGGQTSDLFSPSAGTIPLTLLQQNKVAIVFGANFYGGNWTKLICSPCWTNAAQVAGVVPIPTLHGQAPNAATTVGGWDFVVSSAGKNAKLAWALVDLMENEENQITAANWAGFVPASQAFVKAPDFVNFAPPYNAVSAQVLPVGVISPSSPNYLIWSHGLQEATGAFVTHPDTTVDAAIGIMSNYVTNQLDPSQVETLK